MQRDLDFYIARERLLAAIGPVETESVPLTQCGGRILARELRAEENVPAFDRSPYDGYAFRATDTAEASKEQPVTLRILEEIAAGAVATREIAPGTAAKILTGAPIPPGADAVVMFEKTEFSAETVTVFAPVKSGENIIRAGEDVKAGQLLAPEGSIIDPGLAGTLAAQGVFAPLVYRRPRVAVLSTGSELVEPEANPGPGQIRNSNAPMLMAALAAVGMEPLYLGIAGDSAEDIAALLRKGLADCDAVISTGGVSVGDYDKTPQAMELAGAELLFHGVDMKPGMACAYGMAGKKPVCALSGNPASSITNFYALAVPALKKLAGWAKPAYEEFELILKNGFKKKSPATRLLRGKLLFEGGKAYLDTPKDQGNVVLSSSIGCDAMAIVPAGSGALEPGTTLKGFRI